MPFLCMMKEKVAPGSRGNIPSDFLVSLFTRDLIFISL